MPAKMIKKMQETFKEYDSEMVEAVTKMVSEINGELFEVGDEAITKAVEKELQKHLGVNGESMITKMLGGTQEEVSKKEKSLRKQAAIKFMQEGKDGLSQEEVKMLANPANKKSVMTSNDFSTGGIFAGEDKIEEMEKEILNFSAVRKLVTVRNTREKFITFNKLPLTGRVKAYRRGELSTAKNSGKMQFVKETVPMQTATTFIQVTREDVMYSTGVDLEKIINEEDAEQQAVLESYEMLLGDTSKQEMEGILKNPTVLANALATATTGVITFEDVNGTFIGLKGQYRKNAVWAANSAAIKLLMDLKDTSGRPLFFWNKPLTEKIIGDGDAREEATGMLHGKPLYEFPEMPDTYTTGVPMLIFGDFKAGYIMGLGVDTFMLRDENTNSLEGVINFIFERYTGGAVKMPEAFKVLKSK